MTAEETIASLEAQLKQALERLDEVSEQLRVAQARIEELEKLKTPPPAFVKANKKKRQRKRRRLARSVTRAQSSETALYANPDRRASARHMPNVSVAVGRYQSGALPRGHRCARAPTSGGHGTSYLQRLVFRVPEMV